MALVPKIRNRTISDKPVSSSCTRTSSFRQRLLASCKRFLRIEEHSSSNRGFKDGNNFLVSSTETKKLVAFCGEPFQPLNEEEVALVNSALSKRNRKKILVSHKNSNIDISGETLQCLRPNQWLNDDVTNLYLELLKERQTRDPQKYFKCHFFNTFFYVKLVSGSGYNYKAVSRWTTKRKLGYDLIDCDIIYIGPWE